MSRLDNLKRAVKHFEIDLECEIDYSSDVVAALEDGVCEEGWLSVLHSEEYGNFGNLFVTDDEALMDQLTPLDDEYGKTAVAVMNLDTGEIYGQPVFTPELGSVTDKLDD